jgi:uncharacterized protein (DUF1501 family)
MSGPLDRRNFLARAAGVSLALALPGLVGRQARAQAAPGNAGATPRWDRTLVLIELKGGNDGLNTVVPYADPNYAKLRPAIHVPRERVLQLDGRVGLHRALAPLEAAWRAKELAVVQGVGYPHPNRSHFRSIEIWDTASASSQVLSEGWMSQAFSGYVRRPGTAVDGIVIDFNALPATGDGLRTVVMQDAESFIRQAERMGRESQGSASNPALSHLLAVQGQLHAAALGLRDQLRDAPSPVEPYAAGPWGRELDLATRLLAARVPVVAIKIAIGGFDTHARQVDTHAKLLEALGEGLAQFRRNLIAAGVWPGTLVMTYSEFGRRVRQNGSAGTDHGTAAPHFLLGGNVKGGLHGAYPSLADLVDGDLRHTVDFRSLFATVCRQWWGIPRDFGLRSPQRLDLVS